MAEAEKYVDHAEAARQAAESHAHESGPTESTNHGMEREPETAGTSLSEDIRARAMHPHKGDVGRPGTNEEIYQGSKSKELK